MEDQPPNPLREHFGDRKLPDISRKITACVLCRKQKIKCQMADGPPCSRCKRRGLSCTVNKSLQMILESDADWKVTVSQRLANLENAMRKVAEVTSISEVHDLINHASTPQTILARASPAELEDTFSSEQNGQDERTWEIDIDAAGGPGAIPASHLAQRVQSYSGSPVVERSNNFDIIKRGVITAKRAQYLFNIYHDRFDHFLYRILGENRSFESVRLSSPLLLSAICAVSALQTASSDYDKCYRAFLNGCSAGAFSKDCATEDVQAYCIGAFWLSDMSWNLVGAAVRAATQLQLHRSIYKALEGDKESYLKTRLFYLVYVCDHHFSIPYGRPPMTGSNSDMVKGWRKFLKSKYACEDDARLLSQVQVWSIYSRIQDTFGTNVEALLPIESFSQVRNFIVELDGYRSEWNDSYSRNEYIGNYPNKGLILHHHFARLYLCSHVFRARPTIEFGRVSDLDEIVNTSVMSATSILKSLATDQEIQSYLNGLPSYFFTMITFASVFLLKMSRWYPHVPCIHGKEIFELVAQVVTSLRYVSTNMHEKHLLTSIVHGLEKVLTRVSDPSLSEAHLPSLISTDLDTRSDSGWPAGPVDISLWDNYDFLSFQNLPSGFDFNMDAEG